MNRQLDRRVRRRARNSCEYCRVPQSAEITPQQIDHVIAEKHGGQTIFSNLAVACTTCNQFKGPNIAGIDPGSNRIIRLFNPRKDAWARHFEMRSDGRIIGLTAIGRTTVRVLLMNKPESVLHRSSLIAEGLLVVGEK